MRRSPDCLKILGFVLLALLWLLLSPQPVWAIVAQPERTVLTQERLQERLNNPVNSDGVSAIDLQHSIVDLRPENAEFRDRFYRLLQTALNQSGNPLGLNLSHSLVKGDLNGRNLGVRVPLLEESIQSVFDPEEVDQLKSKAAHLSLDLKNKEPSSTSLPQLTVLRGRLKFEETEFEGETDFRNIFFMKGVDGRHATFKQSSNWSDCRFNLLSNFSGVVFQDATDFQRAYLIADAQFKKADFHGLANFQESRFQGGDFNQIRFRGTADFKNTVWEKNADFGESWWQDRAGFGKSRFDTSVSFNRARFEGPVDFRDTRFSETVNLREASIQGLTDFSDTGFGKGVMLNVSNLMFDSKSAQIMGDPGIIGRVLAVPTLRGNENLLRNLVQNFRQQEQIGDANHIEYLRAKLQLNALWGQIFGVNINTASIPRLVRIGFTREQAETLAELRTEHPFRELTEILQLDEIDLATYTKVYDRAIANAKERPIGDASTSWWNWLLTVTHLKAIAERVLTGLRWLQLEILLLLTGYGTNFPLVFGVGIVAIAHFGLLFWLVDRVRRRIPYPILPTLSETAWMFGSYGLFTAIGLVEIVSASGQAALTLLCLGIFLVPVPGFLLWIIYRRGRYHNLLNVSYLTEDASLRQLRLMIGRLPTMPRYPMFRERYLPILWDRRWNWLNYYDFSLNNFLKFGFNDLRMRDEFMPGLVTTLVWYQWSLGALYLILLFWTLSRTIPGLNLLIYLK